MSNPFPRYQHVEEKKTSNPEFVQDVDYRTAGSVYVAEVGHHVQVGRLVEGVPI